MVAVNDRPEPASSTRAGEIKSYWFRTFGLPQLTMLWELLYVNGVKTLPEGFVLKYVDAIALAYLIMSDGSRSGNTVTLHTQGFGLAGNNILSAELNERFGLHTQVKSHKGTMWVVYIPSTDAAKLRALVEPYVIPSMHYKLPVIRK